MPADTVPSRGFTVREVAQRYRVGRDKVRSWVRSGLLEALNTSAALSGRPRWVILPEALVLFERGRRAAPPPAPRKRKRTTAVDYYP